MGLSPTLIGFAVGILLFNFSCLVYTTFVAGIMAAHDPQGRVILIANIMLTMGLALGPSIGGMLSSRGAFDSVLWLSGICHVMAFAILATVLRTRTTPQA